MKVLLVGSHPSVANLGPLKHRLSEVYARVYAINNSWSVLPGYPLHWLMASDFGKRGTLHPTDWERGCFAEVTSDFRKEPRWYEFPGTGTMILNGLYHIYNTLKDEGLEEMKLSPACSAR